MKHTLVPSSGTVWYRAPFSSIQNLLLDSLFKHLFSGFHFVSLSGGGMTTGMMFTTSSRLFWRDRFHSPAFVLPYIVTRSMISDDGSCRNAICLRCGDYALSPEC
ncbi:MAG: hypothetical protein HGA56_03245 [Chlorobiaceae bacterium]|nr:hypothetical protein [Chlorobiaceae bacterium]